jgi:hypothetical protein
MRRLTQFGCILAAAVLLPAGTAEALIQIDRGIAGARIGNTRAEARAALGKPAGVATGTNIFGRWVRYRFAGGIRVMFQGRTRVTSVTLTGRGDRTARGVGVGSSEAAVKARVKGITCETFGTFRSCHTGSFLAGRRVTDFQIRNGRVASVVVGIVID